MKFQDLPYEMLSKVLNTVDQKTFDNLRFVNSSIEQISTSDRFLHQYVREIRFENDDKFFATLADGTDILIGPHKYLGKQTPQQKSVISKLRKLTHFPTLSFINCEIKDAVLALIVPCIFPNLRTVDKLNLVDCVFKCTELFTEILKKWNVKDFRTRKTSAYYWNFTDKTFALLKGDVDLDVNLDTDYSLVTDNTLISVVDENRQIFKLKGICTSFSMEKVAEAINIAIKENRTVNWNFGTISYNSIVPVKRWKYLADWELMRDELFKCQAEGCQVTRSMDEYRANSQYNHFTTKIQKPGMTIQFTWTKDLLT